MAKVSNELFRRLTWYRRYEEFHDRGFGVFRDNRELLLVMEAAGTFNRLPKDVFTAVIDSELEWLDLVGREIDEDDLPTPVGYHPLDDQGRLWNLRERERASYRHVHVDAELSHRATDYQSYMKRTGDKSVLRDDKELIRVMEAAGTMKRLPSAVRIAFFQSELLWDSTSLGGRPKALQLEYSHYANPYLADSERDD